MNKPKKYRKKPVVIEAMQYLGHYKLGAGAEHGKENPNANYDAVKAWVGDDFKWDYQNAQPVIMTLEDGQKDKKPTHFVSVGDWIIKGVEGEFYSCKPDIFEKTYAGVVAHETHG